ncbi:hypothetical protein B0H14DRAFT_2186687, partial [Mycena olivaceomarginata]
FACAALVACDLTNFSGVALSPRTSSPRSSMREHKWHGPFTMWYSIILCAVGAAMQGWDQTGSNGVNLSFPEEFGIVGMGTDEWIVSTVNSIIFLSAGLVGAWIVDPLNHYLSRHDEIFLTALCLFATPITSGFTHSW